MKVQAVYPSTVMKIACPNCSSEGTIRRDKPPDKDFAVSCPKCKEKFLVKINLRKSYRKEVSIPIKYSLFDSGRLSPKTKNGTIVDISREGLCIETYTHAYVPALHKEGNRFQLSFSLPPRKILLTVHGEVVRIIKTEGKNTFTIGIKFFNLDQFSNQEIGFFLWP